MVLLSLSQIALTSGEIVSLGHVGLWPVILLLCYLGITYLSRVYTPAWRPIEVPRLAAGPDNAGSWRR